MWIKMINGTTELHKTLYTNKSYAESIVLKSNANRKLMHRLFGDKWIIKEFKLKEEIEGNEKNIY